MVSAEDARSSRYTVPASFNPSTATLDIRRSEFIGMIRRVENEEQARRWIDEVRKQHHNATHVCTAFVLGADRDIQRATDDGEPAGTAGIPMMQALLNHRVHHEGTEYTDVSDVCAIAVRYFGGIKLGAGGLVRAYTDTAVAALDATRLIPRQRMFIAELSAPHAEVGRWENEIRSKGVKVLDTDYVGAHATIRMGLIDRDHALEEFNTLLSTLTSGAGHAAITGQRWV